MKDSRNLLTHRFIAGILLCASLLLCLPSLAPAYTRAERARFQASIIDYRPRLNHRYRKVSRRKTDFIIVHTSELGLDMTLRVVSRGKRLPRGRSTAGGHTHYVIARDGRTFRILDRNYVADHAGRSMWNGQRDISKVSIGIELAGYHYAPITEKQYRSAGLLIEILQGVYGLDDRDVLTHSQVAYGRPNRWFRKDHRGRKRCAKNFLRARAGLGPTWSHDPDVRAGRLSPDPQLARVFYSGKEPPAAADDMNVISARNTAWSIAGEDYNSTTTVYKLPDGSVYSGDQVEEKVGWNRLPSNTVVLLNQVNNLEQVKNVSPIKTISESLTAWAIAGKAYNATSTIYFLPSGSIRSGTMIYDWDDLPAGTRLIVGYRGPYRIYEDLSAVQAVGPRYNGQSTVYFLPSHELLAGDSINDFQNLPAGTLIFVPAT